MPSNPPTSDSPAWKVLVASCDAYSDLWPFFFHFLFKYWPEVPRPVYLVANQLRFQHPDVVTLSGGSDTSWGDTMMRALAGVKEESLLFTLDDFLLSTPVDDATMREFISVAMEQKSPYFSLDSRIDAGRPLGDGRLRVTAPGEREIGLNLSFWNKEFLLNVAQPGLNIWQAERRLKDLAAADPRPFLSLNSSTPPLVHYVESVRGRFWKPAGRQHLREHGLSYSALRRPCPLQDESVLGKVSRSVLKRYMAMNSSLRATAVSLTGGWSVAPLKT